MCHAEYPAPIKCTIIACHPPPKKKESSVENLASWWTAEVVAQVARFFVVVRLVFTHEKHGLPT